MMKSQLARQLFLNESDSLPKRMYCIVENLTKDPSIYSFELMQFAGSQVEMKNFTNPGIA